MASRSGKMHIESQNNQLEKEDKIAGVVDPICAKKPLLCPLTVSGSGPGIPHIRSYFTPGQRHCGA